MLRGIFILISVSILLFGISSMRTYGLGSDERPGFFHRHHHLKKWLLIGGVGAATGGVGAVVLGHSVAGGAALGAGTHIGAHEAKEKYKEHKNRRR